MTKDFSQARVSRPEMQEDFIVPQKRMDGWGLGVWGPGVEEVLNESNTYILIKRCLLFVCLDFFPFFVCFFGVNNFLVVYQFRHIP